MAEQPSERERFEAWALERHEQLPIWTGARYRSDVWEDLWICWQARAALSQPSTEQGWKLVPVEPTPEMWGELARDIVWWMYMTGAPHYGSKLHAHLNALGRDIPDWLSKEIPDVAHTPPKGTVAACIYKAMLAASPPPPIEPREEKL